MDQEHWLTTVQLDNSNSWEDISVEEFFVIMTSILGPVMGPAMWLRSIYSLLWKQFNRIKYESHVSQHITIYGGRNTGRKVVGPRQF